MIAKCKAIVHGKTALEYIFRETKLKNKLLIQNLCGDTAERIYEEMNLVNRFQQSLSQQVPTDGNRYRSEG